MDRHDDTKHFVFAHERLDCHRIALELAAAGRRLAARLPASERRLADQLKRASGAVHLLVAEGANRRLAGEKRQRFAEALAECAEIASACNAIEAYELATSAQCKEVSNLARRTAAMLQGLIKRKQSAPPV